MMMMLLLAMVFGGRQGGEDLNSYPQYTKTTNLFFILA